MALLPRAAKPPLDLSWSRTHVHARAHKAHVPPSLLLSHAQPLGGRAVTQQVLSETPECMLAK